MQTSSLGGATRRRDGSALVSNIPQRQQRLAAPIIAAFPDYDTLREIADGLGNGIGLLLEAGAVDERIWEAIGWDVLDL